MILAGDIGGTKSTLMLFAPNGSGLKSIFRWRAWTREFGCLEDLVERFLSQAPSDLVVAKAVQVAAFGCAGAVVGNRVLSSNLPWVVETTPLAERIGLQPGRTLLLNDLVAAASSLAHLPEKDLLLLNAGVAEPRAPKAFVAPGTGLGEALLFWDGNRYRVFPSEASLTDFAPRKDWEFRLLQSLRARTSHVSSEEIVSGRGFRSIHQILFPEVQHAWFDDPGVDPAAQITQQALANACPACEQTLQLWIEAYAAEAANMSLRVLPFGGVYLAGGIVLKILSKLKDGTFVRVFSDRAKLSNEFARIPIYVVLDEDAPVLGAAYEAFSLWQQAA